MEKKSALLCLELRNKKMLLRYKWGKQEKQVAEVIVKEVEDEGKKLEEIEEIVRIGKVFHYQLLGIGNKVFCYHTKL